jgi:ATP-binding cassette subfamily B protein
VVLEGGGIVGVGTHEELLEGCPTYREIVESQLSAKEAA